MSWPELIPPWDQAKYFQTIRETLFTSITGPISVALADPTRVCLIFSAPGDYAVGVSVRSGVALGGGITIMPDGSPFVLTHSMVGPLVQYQWFAVGTGEAANLTVIEVALSQWPQTCPST